MLNSLFYRIVFYDNARRKPTYVRKGVRYVTLLIYMYTHTYLLTYLFTNFLTAHYYNRHCVRVV